MPSKKGFVIPLIIAVLAVLAIGGAAFVTQKKEAEAPVVINPISTTTPISKPIVECKTNDDCREISCVSGGFAHEICTQGKCTMSAEVKNKCSTSCTPNWTCGWAPCINGYQGMTAVDSNNCNISNDGVGIACPAIARECQ
jgi:hypothetical protein